MDRDALQLSFVFPCLDEANTVGICVDEARSFLRQHGLAGEVIVADNGSRDASVKIAGESGARVVSEKKRGYGYAVRCGMAAATGDVIIIADCDTTYDLSDAERMYRMLCSEGFDMVIGDRFAGGIEPGAMPLSHRFGVGVLSLLGRCRFRSDVRDFHCGIRGITREAASKMKLTTGGMEFATEMIAEASRLRLRTGQIPVRLKKCILHRHSKLHTIRDGLRHLKFIAFLSLYGVL